jgi:hypothetical protein
MRSRDRRRLTLAQARRNAPYRPRCEQLETRCLPSVFFFTTGSPDGKMATASRPATPVAFEIEAADDFTLSQPTIIDHATFTGLVPMGATINQVIVEIYRVFPKDSDIARTSGAPTFSTAQVPTRVNSPSDIAFTARDSTAGQLTFGTTVLNPMFSALNSVQPGGIHPKPNQTTGGNGPASGEEVQFSVTFKIPLDLPVDHFFFVPQVLLSTGNFLWLSAPKPIGASGTPFTPDLQEWTRDANLDPDWLRVGTDIVGGAPAPQFNGTFSLSGHTELGPPLVVGADAGAVPEVRLYNAADGHLNLDFLAYDPAFRGGVRVAVGDVNGDGTPDIITAPGPSGGPDIRVFDGQTGQMIEEFFAYNPLFTRGVFVAAADLNGDGKADIITAPDSGGGPDVRVFDGGNTTGIPNKEFAAYAQGFLGGVRVASGKIGGKQDIITAPGPGGGPDVRVFDGTTLALAGEFFAYNAAFTGGVYVAAGDVNGDGQADVITGAGAGGGPNVRVFSGATISSPNPTMLDDFFAYDAAFAGGVRVGALDVNGDGKAEILTGAGPGGAPHVRIFDGTTAQQLDLAQASFFAFDASFHGGVFVGGQ